MSKRDISKDEKTFCCLLMKDFVEDTRVQVEYCPRFREFYIPLLYRGKIIALQCLFYCPWCGSKLPLSVRDQLFNILEQEYGLDDDLDKRVPEEFKTDEWWKKRGL